MYKKIKKIKTKNMEILIIILAMFFSIYISILGFLLVKKKQQHERFFYEMWKKKLKIK